jgi:hypothetical protein
MVPANTGEESRVYILWSLLGKEVKPFLCDKVQNKAWMVLKRGVLSSDLYYKMVTGYNVV